ncbi:zinc-ribbon domain-containing protein [Pseudoflavonifractor phocaeensis]|uniref:zinc-ribbon domain-containing protein n=1 Tax=Pseudoflavonifractor phocaeensis TaxID=1870988 RepID=UPI00195A0A63|nr:zinc ribbon domain-containing protein [Pseudoflavonifractor phocaeensis]MBM6870347.1 zinc ribbon domain-containing protein [Pseudoflavonifractor phocaeensis]
MAFCRNCGSQINDGTMICPKCGASQNMGGMPQQNYNNNGYNNGGYPNPNYNNGYDSGGIGWGILGFCIPLVGLILFLVWKDQKPLSAKAAGMGALISVIIGVVFYILAIIVGMGSYYYY